MPGLLSLALNDVDTSQGLYTTLYAGVSDARQVSGLTVTLDQAYTDQTGKSSNQIIFSTYGNGLLYATLPPLRSDGFTTYTVTGAQLATTGGTVSYSADELRSLDTSSAFHVGDGRTDDRLAPTIFRYLTTPGDVDPSHGAVSVTFAASTADVGSAGMDRLVLQLDRPLTTTTGTLDELVLTPNGQAGGVVAFTTMLDGQTATGGYAINGATAFDRNGNSSHLSTADVVALYGNARIFTVNDTSAPALSSFELGALDVRGGESRIQASGLVSDTAHNAQYLTISLDQPLTVKITGAGHYVAYQQSSSLGFAIVDGVVQAGSDLIAQVGNKPGEYGITGAIVSDAAGNNTSYTAAQFAAMGFATRLTVQADGTAPTLTGLTMPTGEAARLTVTISDPGAITATATATVHLDRDARYGADKYVSLSADPAHPGVYTGGISLSGDYPGAYNITGITVSDAASNRMDYSAAQLSAAGYGTSFLIASPYLGDRFAAAAGQTTIIAPVAGKAYFVGNAIDTTVVLNGNIGDYTLSRVQPHDLSAASADQEGAFLLTATNASGAYAIEQSVATVRFQNGQYLSLHDVPAYVAGSTALAFGGGGDDLMYQDVTTPYQMFVGGAGTDQLYLNGNAHDYTMRAFQASTAPVEAALLDPQHGTGIELVANNGSGRLLIDQSIETVHFRNGQYFAYGDIGSYVSSNGGDTDTLALGLAGVDPAVFRVQALDLTGADKAMVLLNNNLHDFSGVSRESDGTFALYSFPGLPTVHVAQTSRGVLFADGQFLSVQDLSAYLPADGSFTTGTAADDILTPARSGDQYITGLAGNDRLYLTRTVDNFSIAAVDLRASESHPAIHGYELVGNDHQGSLYIDQSVETVHFGNGQYLSFTDLPAYIDPYHG